MNRTTVPDLDHLSHIDPLQQWWDELVPNRMEINSESWFSQHLTDLEWLDAA